MKAATENLPNKLIFNWDATQFICKTSNNAEYAYIVDGKDDNAPVTVVGEEFLDMLIKKRMHMSAAGEACPLVLLIAVSDMKEDEFVVFEIPGLN